MKAVVEIGGKQYYVQPNSVLYVEKIVAEPQSEVVFDKVLAVNEQVGKPYVKNAKIVCQVVKHGKQKKLFIIKHKRYTRMFKRYGHRQPYTKLIVQTIATNAKG